MTAQPDKLYSKEQIENAIAHHKQIMATMGNPIPDEIKDAVGMFQQLLDTMRENVRLREALEKLAKPIVIQGNTLPKPDDLPWHEQLARESFDRLSIAQDALRG